MTELKKSDKKIDDLYHSHLGHIIISAVTVAYTNHLGLGTYGGNAIK